MRDIRYTDFGKRRTPELMLWRAVVARTARDAAGIGATLQECAAARTWLRHNAPQYQQPRQLVCELAELEEDRLRSWASALPPLKDIYNEST